MEGTSAADIAATLDGVGARLKRLRTQHRLTLTGVANDLRIEEPSGCAGLTRIPLVSCLIAAQLFARGGMVLALLRTRCGLLKRLAQSAYSQSSALRPSAAPEPATMSRTQSVASMASMLVP